MFFSAKQMLTFKYKKKKKIILAFNVKSDI